MILQSTNRSSIFNTDSSAELFSLKLPKQNKTQNLILYLSPKIFVFGIGLVPQSMENKTLHFSHIDVKQGKSVMKFGCMVKEKKSSYRYTNYTTKSVILISCIIIYLARYYGWLHLFFPTQERKRSCWSCKKRVAFLGVYQTCVKI